MIYSIKKRIGLLLFMALMATFFTSCEKENSGEEVKVTSITISSSAGEDFLVNTESSFVVKDNNGVDVTSSSEIFVDSVQISNNKFLFSNKGTYVVYANYKELKSNKLSILVKDPVSTTDKTEFTSKVIVHDFTGTWCGFCAAALIGLNEKAEKFPGKLIPIEIHAGGSGSGSTGTEIFDFPNGAAFEVEAYPTVWHNFDKNFEYFAEEDISAYVSNKIKTGLAVNYDIEGGLVTVKVKSDTLLDGRKLAVYVVEGGLIANQSNYDNDDPSSPAYQKGEVIENFEYHNVARATLTESPLGDVISNVASNESEFKFKLDGLSEKVSDMSKTKVIAILLNGEGKYINAQSAVANENKDFD